MQFGSKLFIPKSRKISSFTKMTLSCALTHTMLSYLDVWGCGPSWSWSFTGFDWYKSTSTMWTFNIIKLNNHSAVLKNYFSAFRCSIVHQMVMPFSKQVSDKVWRTLGLSHDKSFPWSRLQHRATFGIVEVLKAYRRWPQVLLKLSFRMIMMRQNAIVWLN